MLANARWPTCLYIHTYTRLTALCPGLPRWASTRKVKPIWILLKQETLSGSGISWAICKSASRSRQITMPAPHHSVFYGPDALPATQPTVSKHWRDYLYAYNGCKTGGGFGVLSSRCGWMHYISGLLNVCVCMCMCLRVWRHFLTSLLSICSNFLHYISRRYVTETVWNWWCWIHWLSVTCSVLKGPLNPNQPSDIYYLLIHMCVLNVFLLMTRYDLY